MFHDEFFGLLLRLLPPGFNPTFIWAAQWELAFWALVLLLTALLAWQRPATLARAEAAFRRLSAHQTACLFLVFALAIGIRLAFLPWIPVPVPAPHDEFSYLLQSDTFCSGRVTNPPHPMWIFFETFHVNLQPTYQSMYPPAQGVALAVGQKLTGSPWAGVVLSVALMCVAICWMLQGWMPPHWALLGGLFTVGRYGIYSYWIDSYFGGAMAAIGGALLLGALARLRQELTVRNSLLFVLGLVILANSRPLEGFLFCVPIVLSAIGLLFTARLTRQQILRAVVPAVLLLSIAGATMLYYNWRGTGNALKMPYVLNQEKYHISRPMLFQKPYPIPHYNHPEMRAFYMYHELPDVLRARERWGIEELLQQKVTTHYAFLVWPLLLLFVPGMMLTLYHREQRVVPISLLLMFSGMLLQIWPFDGHYAAPGAAAIVLILFTALRALGKAGQPRRYQYLARATVLMLFLWMLVPLGRRLENPDSFSLDAGAIGGEIPKQMQRATIESRLMRTPGQHLVIVHYRLHDVPSQEWIYNDANIDASKVVWARDMGREKNQELLRYYANRQVWFADRGDGAVIEPYATYLSLTHPDEVLSAHP